MAVLTDRSSRNHRRAGAASASQPRRAPFPRSVMSGLAGAPDPRGSVFYSECTRATPPQQGAPRRGGATPSSTRLRAWDDLKMSGLATTAAAFVEMAHRIVWATVATVDAQDRPRGRILHPLWQWDGVSLVGWIATGPTRMKRAHLERSPYVSVTYWTASHDTCTAECRVQWELDDDTRQWVWERLKNAPHRSATTQRSCQRGQAAQRLRRSLRGGWSRGDCVCFQARRCWAGTAKCSAGQPDSDRPASCRRAIVRRVRRAPMVVG